MARFILTGWWKRRLKGGVKEEGHISGRTGESWADFFWGCLANGEWLFCSFSLLVAWKRSLPTRHAVGRQLFPFTAISGAPFVGTELEYRICNCVDSFPIMNKSDKVFRSLDILSRGTVPLDQPQRPGQHGVSDGPRILMYLRIALICFSHTFFSLYHYWG